MIYIPTRINQTAAQWAVDATVYTANKILVTTDVYWTGTNQPKYKFANGVQTWSALDYVPIEPKSTTIQFGWTSLNMLDSTNYRPTAISNLLAAGTSSLANKQIKLLNAKSNFDLLLSYNIGTLGSSEGVTIRLVNITQATSVDFTATFSTAGTLPTTYSAVLPCDAGDLLELQFITPIFSLNPIAIIIGANLNF